MHQRLYIEKRPEYADDHALTERLKTRLDLAGLQRVRRLAVYDLYDCPAEIPELTQIGKECHSNCAIREAAGDCVMPREGIFTKVLKAGKVKKGDILRVIE